MDELKLLGVALGLACLAGVNLYLTVFVTGLAIHQHWIVLVRPTNRSPSSAIRSFSGSPARSMFWNFSPTKSRGSTRPGTRCTPSSGRSAARSSRSGFLVKPSPTFDVVVALAAGGASLVTHSAKASTRLVTNASPEPFSNIALSLAEDVAVVGGLALIHFNPLWALGIFVLLLSIILYFAPKIFRAVRMKLWLIWKKLNGPAESEVIPSLPKSLSSRSSSAFARENLLGETIAWAVPCISKRLRGVPANSSGHAHRDE